MIFFFFFIFAKNIDYNRGGSNEYPQSMFWIKNKQNRYVPEIPSFTIHMYKSGVYGGYSLHEHVFLMLMLNFYSYMLSHFSQ